MQHRVLAAAIQLEDCSAARTKRTRVTGEVAALCSGSVEISRPIPDQTCEGKCAVGRASEGMQQRVVADAIQLEYCSAVAGEVATQIAGAVEVPCRVAD